MPLSVVFFKLLLLCFILFTYAWFYCMLIDVCETSMAGLFLAAPQPIKKVLFSFSLHLHSSFWMKSFIFHTLYVDLCSVAIKEDWNGGVRKRNFGGDSSLGFRELHTVNQLRRAAEGQDWVVQLHHNRVEEALSGRLQTHKQWLHLHWTVPVGSLPELSRFVPDECAHLARPVAASHCLKSSHLYDVAPGSSPEHGSLGLMELRAESTHTGPW